MHSYKLTAWSRVDRRQISVFWMMELDFIFDLWKMQGDYSDSSCGGLCVDPVCLPCKSLASYSTYEFLWIKMISCNVHKVGNTALTHRNVILLVVNVEGRVSETQEAYDFTFCIRQRICLTALLAVESVVCESLTLSTSQCRAKQYGRDRQNTLYLSGSGFILRRTSGNGFVVMPTNHHTIQWGDSLSATSTSWSLVKNRSRF